MIVAKCPLRIGLVGGSTDLEGAIETNGRGAVISFPATVYVYIAVHDDRMGMNTLNRRYIINYSRREESGDLNLIKNDVARVCLEATQTGPIGVTFTADVSSEGSGLAASSAYTIALLKALRHLHGKETSDYELCGEALTLERSFNPLTGRQDAYGCGLGALKRLDFLPCENRITLLSDRLLRDELDMFLVYTGIRRSSTEVLKTLDHKRSARLLPLVDDLQQALGDGDRIRFGEIIRQGWVEKRASSKEILSETQLLELDDVISGDPRVVGHKLLGAGGGGYFLVFLDRERCAADRSWHGSALQKLLVAQGLSIGISPDGVRSQRI